MTILCDSTIRRLCDPKAQHLEETLYNALVVQHQLDYLAAVNNVGIDKVPKPRNRDLLASCLRERTADEVENFVPMIEPFNSGLIRRVGGNAVISFGLTSYGYDVTLSDEFRVFTNINSVVIDPKRLNEACLVQVGVQTDPDTGEKYILMPPNSYLLGRTREYFRIPRDVLVVCLGKSTYARSGAIVNVTPIEPGFEGNVVIEISNSTSLPARIYANEGISQFLFFRGDHPCEVSYGDRNGKYQGQTGITLPKV